MHKNHGDHVGTCLMMTLVGVCHANDADVRYLHARSTITNLFLIPPAPCNLSRPLCSGFTALVSFAVCELGLLDYRKSARAVDDLKQVAQNLRRLPVVDPLQPVVSCLAYVGTVS